LLRLFLATLFFFKFTGLAQVSNVRPDPRAVLIVLKLYNLTTDHEYQEV